MEVDMGDGKKGKYRESAKQIAKEISFMKEKGAPKKMIEHEKREQKSMKRK